MSGNTVALGSIATAFGADLASQTLSSDGTLPTTLAGSKVDIVGPDQVSRTARLYFVSPNQINFYIPTDASVGITLITVTNNAGSRRSGTVLIAQVSPGLFVHGVETGVRALAAAYIHTRSSNGNVVIQPTLECSATCKAAPVSLEPDREAVIELYGTGITGGGLSVTATVDGLEAKVSYVGRHPVYLGLDQVNVTVPVGLPGAKIASISVSVGETRSNTVSMYELVSRNVQNEFSVRFSTNDANVGPFPSDAFTVPDSRQLTGRRVSIEAGVDCDTEPSTCAEVSLINELDGFSQNPIIKIRFTGQPNISSLSSSIFVIWLEPTFRGTPPIRPVGHIGRMARFTFDRQLRVISASPDSILSESRRYALLITNKAIDTAGRPASPDPSFMNCLGTSPTQYCGELASILPLLSSLDPGITIISAAIFTTMSSSNLMTRVAQLAEKSTLRFESDSNRRIWNTADISSIVLKKQIQSAPAFRDIPLSVVGASAGSIGRIGFYTYPSVQLLGGNGVTRQAPTAEPLPELAVTRVRAYLFLPGQPPPAKGYPLLILGHGLADSALGSPLELAKTFAANGLATIAIDATGHGGGKQGQLLIGDLKGVSQIPTLGRGWDLSSDGTIEDGEGCLALIPAIVGLRDCIRQTAADLLFLASAIRQNQDFDGDGQPDIDVNRVYFAGRSLGSLYGVVFSALDKSVRSAAFNVGGGSVIAISRSMPPSTSFARVMAGLRTPSLIQFIDMDTYAAPEWNGPAKIVDVTSPLDRFWERAEWLQSIGDPYTYAPYLTEAPLPDAPARTMLWQMAAGDQTVSNTASWNLIRETQKGSIAVTLQYDRSRAIDPRLPRDPHSYLTDSTWMIQREASQAAQRQIAEFFKADGTTVMDANLFLTAGIPALFSMP